MRAIAEEVGVWDQLVAAYLSETLLGAGAEAMTGQTLDPQAAAELDDVWAQLTPAEKANAELFADVNTMGDLVAARAQIEREALLAQRVESGPLNPIVASILAQIAAPENWLPFAGPVRGAGALRGAATIGGRVALETAAVEATLHQLQRTRTFSESVAAVAMSAALGGAIGGVLGRGVNVDAARRRFGRSLDELQKEATKEHAENIEEALTAQGPRGSVGAAFNDELGSTAIRLDPADTMLAPSGKLNKGLAKILRAAGFDERAARMEQGQFGFAEMMAQLKRLRIAPVGLELMTSPFPAVREYALRLADTGLDTVGIAAGRAMGFDPVNLRVRWAVQSAALLQRRIFAASYAEHVQAARAAGGKPLSKTQFSEEVSRALRRDTAHPDPAVAKAARSYRDEIITPTGKLASETKLRALDPKTGENQTLLPDFLISDKKFADRYLTRVYDKGNIRRHGKEWRALLRAYLKRDPDTRDLLDEEIDDIVETVTDHILNGNPVLDLDIPVKKRQPRKLRALRIDDTLLDSVKLADGTTVSFLKNNVDEVTSRYVALMASDIEFARAFGTTDPTEEMVKEIRRQTEEQARAATTAKEREAITQRGEREANLIKEMVLQTRQLANRVGPEYSVGARILNSMRQLQFMRLLGLAGIGSLPDAARVVMMHGFRRTLGVAMRDMQTGFRGFKASRATLARMGEAADMALATTAKNLNDLGTGTSELTLVERGLERGTALFGNLNGLNLWNQTMKRFAGAVVLDSILESAQKLARGTALSARELRDMAALNLTESDLLGFAREFELGRAAGHSDAFDNVRFTDYSAWQDRALARKLESALGRAVGDLVITPGVADAPLWGNSELGKTILQFKKFGFAANQRTTTRAIQRGGEAAIYQGLAIMVALGAVSFYVRMAVAGRLEEYFEMEVDELILNAVDRAGVVPLLLEMNNQFGAFFGQNNSLTGILTGAAPEKYAARGWLTNLLGPTAGFAESVYKFQSYARQGPMDAADWNRAVGLLPGQNLPILSNILDAAAEELGQITR